MGVRLGNNQSGFNEGDTMRLDTPPAPALNGEPTRGFGCTGPTP
jgi:hypothetical protein